MSNVSNVYLSIILILSTTSKVLNFLELGLFLKVCAGLYLKKYIKITKKDESV